MKKYNLESMGPDTIDEEIEESASDSEFKLIDKEINYYNNKLSKIMTLKQYENSVKQDREIKRQMIIDEKLHIPLRKVTNVSKSAS